MSAIVSGGGVGGAVSSISSSFSAPTRISPFASPKHPSVVRCALQGNEITSHLLRLPLRMTTVFFGRSIVNAVSN